MFVVSKKPRNYESLNPAFACFGYSFLEIERAVERSIIIKIYKTRLKSLSPIVAQYILQNYRIPSVPTNPQQTHNGPQTDFTTNAAAP